MKRCVLLIALLQGGYQLQAQEPTDSTDISKSEADAQYIAQVEEQAEPDKVLHAEPLYIDLIRDLGARRGEREWNVGLGLTDRNEFDSYEALIEYEWAPINRLGFEVELPFTFYGPTRTPERPQPASQLNSLKFATQWSFFVSQRLQMTAALGYIHEIELTDFNDWRRRGGVRQKGNLYNPFLVVARRWGQNWHTLLYTGPSYEKPFGQPGVWMYEAHTSLHYLITGTRNFIGLEVNKYWSGADFDLTLRPQMRLGIADNLLVGIVGGIPVSREQQRLSSFVRLIYEPGHRH